MTARSDIEHWQINATVYIDRVEEIHYITDPERNIRRRPQTKVWKVEQFLGRGGFGESKEAAVFVDFFGWFKDGSDVFLAMEYVPLGDLETNVVAHSGKVPEVEARDITQQILLGLEIMHAESFAHRDLKPQNVLVVHGPPQWWVKLADFGLSKRLTETTAYDTKGGTQSYMAPEVLDYDVTDISGTEYTNAVDLWAVGCITFRLVTGIVPFPPGKSLWKYCEDQSLFPYGPCFDSGITSSCFKFIKGLLEAHPKKRPSASQALAHTWVSLGSNIERRSIDGSRSSQETPKFLVSTVSSGDYNTVSHDGLKSIRLPSPPHIDSLKPWAPLNINSSKSKSVVKQLPTKEDATLPELKLDMAASYRAVVESNPWGSTHSYSNVQPPSPAPASLRATPPRRLAIPLPDIGALISRATPQNTPLVLKPPITDTAPRILLGHNITLNYVVFSPNGKVLASAYNGYTIRLSDVAKHVTIWDLEGHEGDICSVAFSPDGNMLASRARDCTVRLWGTDTGVPLQTLSHGAEIHSMAFSPNGNMLASSSGDKDYDISHHIVQLWDVAKGTRLRTLKDHTKPIVSIAFSPYGNVVASASSDKRVLLWNVATGAVQTLCGHTQQVESVAFSPHGNVVASGSSDKTVRLWDAATGAVLKTLETRRDEFNSVAFSPNGNVLASVSEEETIWLWSVATGNLINILWGHHAAVNSMAFSPDSKILASASGGEFSPDNTVRLWDTASGRLLQTLHDHQKEINSVAFSPDGTVLASASADCAVRLWNVSTERRDNVFEDAQVPIDAVVGLWQDDDAAAAALVDESSAPTPLGPMSDWQSKFLGEAHKLTSRRSNFFGFSRGSNKSDVSEASQESSSLS
ncbi:hypothetical protein V494_08235 [Pseudogymnoascus sp. VKM F-4513 (FW-928)]|nr:hypothetical protein V494_08235 [Pseudogymnoascus sp. VKM F-4513 (FW-928)]